MLVLKNGSLLYGLEGPRAGLDVCEKSHPPPRFYNNNDINKFITRFKLLGLCSGRTRSYVANWIHAVFANFSVFFCAKWVKILLDYSFVCKQIFPEFMSVCRRSSEKWVWIALNTRTSAGNRAAIPAAAFSPFFWNCRLSHLVSYLSYMFEEIALEGRKNSWWHKSRAFCGNAMEVTLRE
jgi:hypothetical protein